MIRDLFRKSGRPLERELDLQPLDLVREHRFEDGTALRLPSGSRAAQLAAFDGLGAGPRASSGSTYVDALRRRPGRCCAASYLERPWDPALVARASSPTLLGSREMLHKRLQQDVHATSGCGSWPATRS